MNVIHEDERGRACDMHVINDKSKLIQNVISDTRSIEAVYEIYIKLRV